MKNSFKGAAFGLLAVLFFGICGALAAQNDTTTGRVWGPNLTLTGILKGSRLDTSSNCSDSAGAAACGTASAGSVVVDAAATTTVVSTTAVTANSEIFVLYDSSLSARLGITCNTTVALPSVTARTAATSFTISVPVAPTVNPACYSFFLVN